MSERSGMNRTSTLRVKGMLVVEKSAFKNALLPGRWKQGAQREARGFPEVQMAITAS